MKLKTKRLIIRRFNEGDFQDLYDYLSQEDVVRYEPYDIYSKESTLNELKNRIVNENFLAVCLMDTGKLIGNLYYQKNTPEKINTFQIGYVFNSDFQGKGYAIEATEVLIKHLFLSMKAHRIIAMCNTENSKSWRLLEKLGFRREATRIKNMFFDTNDLGEPNWFNSYQYALLNEEWRKQG